MLKYNRMIKSILFSVNFIAIFPNFRENLNRNSSLYSVYLINNNSFIMTNYGLYFRNELYANFLAISILDPLLVFMYKCSTHSREKAKRKIRTLFRLKSDKPRVSYLDVPFHGRKSAIEGSLVRRERVAYAGGFRQTELLTMKRRGRNSSTRPRLFRERRKVVRRHDFTRGNLLFFPQTLPPLPSSVFRYILLYSFTPEKRRRLARP